MVQENPSQPEREETLKQLLGVDPNKYIGGQLVGLDKSFAISDENAEGVGGTLIEIKMTAQGTGWYIEFIYENNEGEKSQFGCASEYLDPRKSADGTLEIDLPYSGSFKIIPSANVTPENIRRTTHDVMSKKMYGNN